MRLFLAIPIPEDICRELTEMRQRLRGAKWVKMENFHLTLCFLGDCSESDYYLIQDHFEDFSWKGFEISLKGAGHFGSKKEPRTLWTGVTPQDELCELQKQVSRQIDMLGFELEKRKYSPHLTLARLKQTPFSQLAKVLEAMAIYQSRPFWVDRFALYSSKLKDSGAEYTIERTFTAIDADLEQSL